MKIPFLTVLLMAVFATGCPAQKPEVEEPAPDVGSDTESGDCQPGAPGCEGEAIVPEDDEGALDDADFVEDAPCSGGDDEVPLEGGPDQ